jgi:hypothetical protein
MPLLRVEIEKREGGNRYKLREGTEAQSEYSSVVPYALYGLALIRVNPLGSRG